MADLDDQKDHPPREGVVAGTGFALATQVTTTLFTGVLTLYLVRALGPGDYGIFGLALGISTIVLLFSDLGVSYSAARFVAERRDERQAVQSILADALRLKLILATTVATILVALSSTIADAFGEPGMTWALRGIALAAAAQSVLLLYLENFIAMGQISRNVRIVFVESLTECTTSIVLVALAATAAAATFGRAIGYGIGMAAAIVVATRMLGRASIRLRRSPAAKGRGHTRQILGYALPLLVTNSAYTLFSTVDVLLVGAILGTAEAGLFAAPARLIVFSGMLGLAVASAVAPRMARHRSDPAAAEALRRAMRLLVMVQALFIAPLLVWTAPLIALLLGEGFRESADVLRALVPYMFLLGLGPLITTSVNYIGLAGRRIPIVFGALAIDVVIGLTLLPTIGVVAAGISISAAYLVYLPAHLYLCSRHVELRIGAFMLTIARSLVAAAAMAAVLFVFGTSNAELEPWELIVGGVAGVATYAAVLVGIGELRPNELRAVARIAQTKLSRG